MILDVDNVAHVRPGDILVINVGDRATVDDLKKMYEALEKTIGKNFILIRGIESMVVMDRYSAAQAVVEAGLRERSS